MEGALMNRFIGFFCAVFLLFSAEAGAAQEIGRLDAALRLLDAMDMRVNLANTVEQVTLAEVEKNPKLEPYKGVMLEFMNKYMGFDNIKSELADIYANAFTQTELEELARFYQTPVGKKILQKLPELTVEGARLGQRKVEEHLGELQVMISREAERIRAQPGR